MQLYQSFPFVAIKWQIDERLQLTARYSLPLDGEVLLEYTLHEDWTLFGGYESSYDAFRLDGDEHDRLFFRQRRVEAGVRWSPIDNVDLELAGGYAFDQEFESGWDVRDTDSVAEVDAAPFVRVAVTVYQCDSTAPQRRDRPSAAETGSSHRPSIIP